MSNYNTIRPFPKVFASLDEMAGNREDTIEQAAVTSWTTKLTKHLQQTGVNKKDFIDGANLELDNQMPPVLEYNKY